MVSQVVMRALDEGTVEFRVLDNPGNLASITFEEPIENQRIPRFGSQDLAGLAEIAESNGYEIEEFEIVDSSMNALPEKQQNQVSKRLRKALRKGGAAEVVRVLMDDYPTFRIDGIDVLGSDDGSFVLRRNGVALIEPGVSPRDLLLRAWSVMHFA